MLACDTNSYRLGAVISRVYPSGEVKPVAHASHILTDAEEIIVK